MTPHSEIFLKLEGSIDIGQQTARLQKDLQKTTKEWEKFQKKLSNQKFLDNAKESAILEAKYKLEGLDQKLSSLKKTLSALTNS